MKPTPLVRGLTLGLAAAVLLPIVLAVTLGTGSLLAAVGDTSAAAVCRRVALAIGMLWVVSLVATTVLSALLTLAGPRRPRAGLRRRPRRLRQDGVRPERDGGHRGPPG